MGVLIREQERPTLLGGIVAAMSDEGRTSDEYRVAGVNVHAIGQRLIDLGELLKTTGQHTENPTLRKHIDEADRTGVDELHEEVDREVAAAIRRTLMGLSQFRRDYADWERITVEYALKRFTQRDVASMLGVGLSTVNRWAQHPLTYDED